VTQGTPEEIARTPASHTGRFLAEVLARRPVKRAGDDPQEKVAAKPKRSRTPKVVRQAAE
jgi:excinuclease ABC subunit A